MSTPHRDRPEKFYPTKFVVEGKGDFPIDMLRYDRAVPATERDANTITREGRTELVDDGKGNTVWTTSARRVSLVRYSSAGKSGPCIERWRSFGWRVVEVEWSDGTKETL